jgi:uroporphyrinogen-III synthase
MKQDNKPLQGKRVVITRAAHQAEGLAARLREYGAEIVLCPLLAMAAPMHPEDLPNALRNLLSFDMLIVMSANGANAINSSLKDNGIAIPPGVSLEVIAVGPATAGVLVAMGLHPQTPAGAGSAAKLFEKIAERVRGKSILVVQSEDADDLFSQSLFDAGAKVTAVEGYRTEIPLSADENVRALFTPEFNAHVVTFASGQMGRNFYDVLARNGLQLPNGVVTASLGPQTTNALRAIGKPPLLQAEETTAQSLADVIALFYKSRL